MDWFQILLTNIYYSNKLKIKADTFMLFLKEHEVCKKNGLQKNGWIEERSWWRKATLIDMWIYLLFLNNIFICEFIFYFEPLFIKLQWLFWLWIVILKLSGKWQLLLLDIIKWGLLLLVILTSCLTLMCWYIFSLIHIIFGEISVWWMVFLVKFWCG